MAALTGAALLAAAMAPVAWAATPTPSPTPSKASTGTPKTSGQGFEVRHLGGADRYATAAAISSQTWTQGAPTVYIASGETFVDALSAGPAAAAGSGPLLLTQKNALPVATAAEVSRLKPNRIVVVGGTAAVSKTVYGKLAKLAPSIVRYAGQDRYETSRMVAQKVFGTHKPEGVWIATGTSFPDALSASAVAGRDKWPIVLVPGSVSALDATTGALIEALGVRSAKIAGGEGVVSAGIESSLRQDLDLDTTRFGGKGRIETSNLIADAHYETSSRVLQATAWNFPDALAGGALAAYLQAPLILTDPQRCALATTRLTPPPSAYYILGAAALWNGCFDRYL